MIARYTKWLQAHRSEVDESAELEVSIATPQLPSLLLNTEELARHARILAGHHISISSRTNSGLNEILDEHQQIIARTYKIVSQCLAAEQKVTPAAVWLLDNDYVLQEQVQLTRTHLPKGYSRQLPRLTDGPYAGLPRVYELACELVMQFDGRLDEKDLSGFITAYQSVASLTLGELWAVPIMLRLALVGKVRQVAQRVSVRQTQRQAASQWAIKFIDMAHSQPKRIVILLGELLRSQSHFSGLFIAELASRLQGQHVAIGSVLSWLEHELIDRGDSLEAVMHRESQDISANQVSISNCIASFRHLSSIDWRDFVEEHSLVEKCLRKDPADVYSQMDFYTRDRYRHAVEHIAKRCDLTEVEVAQQAVLLAHKPNTAADDAKESSGRRPVDMLRLSHVGWFLIDQGRSVLEERVGYRPSFRRRISRLFKRLKNALYIGVLAGFTSSLTAACVFYAWYLDANWISMALIGVLVFLLASQTALSMINWLVTLLVRPRALPRMDFEKGITRQHATAVIVPNMISSLKSVDSMVQALEVRYLANRQDHLKFVLLTDFVDAPAKDMPEDRQLIRTLLRKIDELNDRHEQDGKPFYLMHRPRQWNACENTWMGRERKRGKIESFNHFLLSGQTRDFSEMSDGIESLRESRYVIVLDADTQLPPQAASHLAGAMAHPLNRPVIDPKTNCVVRGYGLLQPKVSLSLTNAEKSLYSRLLTLNGGLDPYSREVSDVYQDLFGEGSFIGKGIYDLHAFHTCTSNRFPDNTILSHDLIEGSFARSGFLSDVELLEDAPSRYTADVGRRHRWIRGDWQISRWLLPYCPCKKGGSEHNPLGHLSRWKMLDNLRRSLLPIAGAGLIALGLVEMEHPVEWLAIALGLLFMPALIRSVHVMMATSRKQPRLRVLERQAVEIVHGLLGLVFMPYEALMSLSAISKVLWRKCVSGKKLLEWQTSAAAEKNARTDLLGVTATMWIGPAVGVLMLVLGWVYTESAPAAVPLGLCWLLSPVLAWWLSRPLPAPSQSLNEEDRDFLRQIARRTWHFFDLHTNQNTNWLAPDNYQQQPAAMLAQRTSPTNIGLGLLSTLAAGDFGYLTPGESVRRIERTLQTMGQLERYRGHFFNWYDTQALTPLQPKYVSAVDSGNLAGCLLVLCAGLREMKNQPVVSSKWVQGTFDTLHVLQEEITTEAAKGRVSYDTESARKTITRMKEILASCKHSRGSCQETIEGLVHLAEHLTEHIGLTGDASRWAEALADQLSDVKLQLSILPMGHALADTDARLLIRMLEEAKVSPQAIDYFKKITQHIVSLNDAALLQKYVQDITPSLEHAIASTPGSQGVVAWFESVKVAAQRTTAEAVKRIETLDALEHTSSRFALMDFTFLFDSHRKQFSIGFHPDHQRLDNSYYDFLASEARIASYVAIAQGQVPVDHWFMLGRRVASVGSGMALTSWSGSMFEYLMPDLIMPTYPGTLLHESSMSAVREQINYAKKRHVPWGISESGYNLVDSLLQYQYKAFGLPTLGFKRGLSDDLVIAPYAAVMAVMTMPAKAVANLRKMKTLGFLGTAGFYEAVDYTKARVPHGKEFAVIESWMSHHSGMSLLALASRLLDQPMQARFMAMPELKAMQLLLQERVPLTMPSWSTRELDARSGSEASEAQDKQATIETYSQPDPMAPHVALVGNSRYHVMLTETGGGVTHWQDLALTRWQRDRTLQQSGTVIYVRDVGRGKYWSSTYHPTARKPDYYLATFSQGKVEYVRVDDEIETQTQIAVSPSDDVEVRRVRVTNLSHVPRTIEVTSYVEVVLAKPATDMAHRAFSNLFVQSELLEDYDALLLTRRARAEDENPPWMFHVMPGQIGNWSEATFETDREKFIGRNRWSSNPQVMEKSQQLSNTTGAVLDPIASIRRVVELQPGESAELDFVIGAGMERQQVQTMVERYSEKRFSDRIFESAWTHSQVVQQQLGVDIKDIMIFRRLAAALIFGEPTLRASAQSLMSNKRGQSSLWGHGISGDLPLVFVSISDTSGLELAGKLIQAHAWWRRKGLKSDLVILVEEKGGYRQDLISTVMGMAQASVESPYIDKPAGVFVRNMQNIAEEDKLLFQALADVWLSDRAGSLQEQASRYNTPGAVPKAFTPAASADHYDRRPVSLKRRDLQFENGTGGFTQDGKEYVIRMEPGQCTPSPWSNVLANGAFGTVVTEAGSGYTWFENAHEFRLTPWDNDPVSGTSGEVLYLRDEGTGEYWSPTSSPTRGPGDYICRHGLGYSVYEHQQAEIFSETTIYVAFDAPVKFHHVKLRNTSNKIRRVSAWACFDWVLGEHRDRTQSHLVTKIDPRTGTALATNPFSQNTQGWTSFAACHAKDRTFTGDRMEFFGRSGSRISPASLKRTKLSNRVGPGLDPCAGFQCTVEIPPGEEREVVFMLGAGHSEKEALETYTRYQGLEGARRALQDVWKFWDDLLGAVSVETPEPALDVMLNHWVIYQTIACRLWARSGFYQSGGAYGFRDQLQDTMSLVHTAPWLLRQQLLANASRQFKEGDVQHWWHPPGGQGVRTHFSDDYLWLPYAAARYVLSTNDTGVLDEQVSFLEGRLVKPEEEAYYEQPGISDQTASLYDHCVRSIRHARRWGVHGLPLIGCGDWNDGMNRIGVEGKGESVWLAFFLYDVCKQFARVAQARNDSTVVSECQEIQDHLAKHIEANAWDGNWYRRAYFDDGTPVGSAQNMECQIDSIAQSWSVISGAGDPIKAETAMESLSEKLMDDKLQVIKLFTPAFDKSDVDPGYIKGYVPGVRENGAQYTHAAIWAAFAFAKQGDAKQLWKSFGFLNPVFHSDTPEETAVYRVEPYVMAADIYTNPQHPGRGGWTWYTGSSGWFYRLMLEEMLGIKLDLNRLVFSPCLPQGWRNYKVHYRYRKTMYHLDLQITGSTQGGSKKAVKIIKDGRVLSGVELPLVNDETEHHVTIELQ